MHSIFQGKTLRKYATYDEKKELGLEE